MIRLLSALAAAGALVAAPLAAQAPTPLTQVMSAEELARTGVDRLSPAERTQLEAWLARYTATVASAARSLPAEGQAARLAPPAGPVLGQSLVVRPRRGAVPGAVEIADVMDGGTFIRLADGTMWEVYLPDRPYTVGWRSGDFVLVERPASPVQGFERSLTNGAARSTASVRFAGVVRAGSARPGAPATPQGPGTPR